MIGREQDIAHADAQVPRRMARRVDESQAVEPCRLRVPNRQAPLRGAFREVAGF